MSKLNRFQKIVIGFIVFFVAMGFLLKTLNLQNKGYDVFVSLKYALIEEPVKTIQNWLEDFAHLQSVQKENEELKKEMAAQPFNDALLNETTRRVKELEETMEMKSTLLEQGYQSIQADVVHRDSEQWNNLLTINKGKNDGIANEMVVVNTKGVVGKVVETSDSTSKVKLLTTQDKQNSVSIKIQIDEETTIEGILQGYDADEGLYTIHMFEDSDEIKEEMEIITSGKGGVYPSGLLVGSVERVEELANQIGKTVFAKPVDDFQNFNVVSVIGNPEYH